jgi:hypothetical protein
MIEKFNPDFMRPYLNTRFRIAIPDIDPLELELVDIKERNNEGMESFSLIFKGPLDRVVYDNTYPMEHDQIGAFEMFIGPFLTPTKKDAIYYQAVFSKLK